MFLCYLDESGSPEPTGTSHFVLLGLALPATSWKARDLEVVKLKQKHRLEGREVHTAWMIRKYPEQERISGFTALSDADRRAAVNVERKADLAKASLRGQKAITTLARNYKKTEAYTHLTHAERVATLVELAGTIGTWSEAVLFCDAQMKAASSGPPEKIMGFAFEQIVTRFHHFICATNQDQAVGLLVQDNNKTAATHLTDLMRRFHQQGTAFSNIDRIVETPLFVDSELTSMVQLADLCCYAARRFFENGETNLFDRIYDRFHRANSRLVGLRHYTGKFPCSCRVCQDHGR